MADNRNIERKKERKKKEQESAEAISGLKRSNYYLHFNQPILNFLLLDGANIAKS